MAKHSFQDLYKTYQGFIVPSYSVTVNESDTLGHGDLPVISEIEVELTAGYESSVCNLIIFQGVELESEKKQYTVDSFIRGKMKLGNVLEVKLGYAQERKTVFKGLISAVELDYEAGSGFQIRVEAMDAKRLMMNNYRSSQPRKDLKKYSDAVREVLKKYAKSLGKQTVSDTPEQVLALEQHNQSDYEFLVALAKKLNYAFYIINNDLFFEELGKDTSPVVELHTNNLYSFHREISLADQIAQFTVRANDETNPLQNFESTAKKFKAVGKGKKGSQDIAAAVQKNAQKTIIDPSVSSAKEAQARAEAELARHAFRFAHGGFKTVGIPEIVPGKMLTIKGFGEDYDNDYYLKKVTHLYSSEGYFTRGELGVNKI